MAPKTTLGCHRMNGIDRKIYVDPLTVHPPAKEAQARRVGTRNGNRWSHLWSDDIEALHAMAAEIGMRKTWFQNKPGFPHYDLTPGRRIRAIQAGAVERSLSDWCRERRARVAADSIPQPAQLAARTVGNGLAVGTKLTRELRLLAINF